MALISLSSPFATNARVIKAAAAVLIAVPVLWLVLYATGAFPWLGYERLSRSSIRQWPVGIVGETRSGTGFGINEFWFFRGQTIVVSYDAEIRRGCLWMHVWHLFRRGPGADVSRCVTESGKGEWEVPVVESGVYHIFIDGSPMAGAGRGWDMTYSVWWGVRPAL